MLKKICGLFLGLVVLAGSACVTPTHASSAAVIITSVQAGGVHGALDEFVVVYNNAGVSIDVSGWCLANKSSVQFACFDDVSDAHEHTILPAYSAAVFVSERYVDTHEHNAEYYYKVFAPSHQSSGSLVGNSDTIALVTKDGEVVDSYTWGSTVPAASVWSRIKLLTQPDIFADTGSLADWIIAPATELPESMVEIVIENGEVEESEDPEESPVETLLSPFITELLPNASGSDTGNEFIELYNPNETAGISLAGYQLRIGSSTYKWVQFPEDTTLQPGEWKAFYNSELSFTLVNTTGTVQLFKGEVPAGEEIMYESPKDDTAWALIEGSWQYTSPTPNDPNVAAVNEQNGEGTHNESVSTLKPCAANQYRSPETNRCRLIATQTSSLSPCKEGQVRNPETNRCRSVSATTSGLAPCKEGYERNEETNRCRKIVQLTTASHGVKGVQTDNSLQVAWYFWLAILGIVGAIVSYAVWEWREELQRALVKLRASFTKRP